MDHTSVSGRRADLQSMRVISGFLKYRGLRVVTCPETDDGAAVTLDAVYAALTGDLAVSNCSRWPERAGCAESCLCEIADSPEDCLLRSIVRAWYEGKSCAACGRAIATAWHDAPPAILHSDGTTREWKDVPPAQLPAALRTGWPLCWQCNNVMELERLHPGSVTRRPHHADAAVKPPGNDPPFSRS
jgi:hypothetical protein